MVSSICKFGITYILPNNSWLPRCFRSVKLVVYAVHAQCMQRYVAMPIRCLGLRAISHGARWCVCSAPLSVSGCTPPPSPRGCRKNGAALRRRPMRYDTQPFETSRQTSSRSTFIARSSYVHRTGNAHSVCSTCVLRAFSAARSWQSVLGRWRLNVRFHAFPKEFHTLSG